MINLLFEFEKKRIISSELAIRMKIVFSCGQKWGIWQNWMKHLKWKIYVIANISILCTKIDIKILEILFIDERKKIVQNDVNYLI